MAQKLITTGPANPRPEVLTVLPFMSFRFTDGSCLVSILSPFCRYAIAGNARKLIIKNSFFIIFVCFAVIVNNLADSNIHEVN